MNEIKRNRIVGQTEERLQPFICGICHNVLTDAVITRCCDRTYCRHCITRWLTDHKSCPTHGDRKRLMASHLMSAPKRIRRQLNGLDVKCDNYMKGCPAVIKLDQLSEHIEECEHKSQTYDKIVKVEVRNSHGQLI